MHKKFRKINSYGVSTIVGYALTLAICAMILTTSTIIVSTYANRRNESAARIEAQALANRVVNMINEVISLKQMMPDEQISYQKTMELPDRISSFSYYIEVTNTKVTVKTTNGQVSESCTTYNVDVTIVDTINDAGTKVNGGNYIKISIDAADLLPVDIIVENA